MLLSISQRVLSFLSGSIVHSFYCRKRRHPSKKPRKKQYKILQKTQNLSLIISIKTSEKNHQLLLIYTFKNTKKKIKKKRLASCCPESKKN
jgi:hypothetical protein